MKRIEIAMKQGFALLSFVFVVAGCTTEKDLREPELMQAEERNPYDAKVLIAEKTAYNWQQANRETIEKATSLGVLSQLVASDETCEKLLKEVKDAYSSDPIVLSQIASVTQAVMDKKSPLASFRNRWVSSLLKAMQKSKSSYHALFYLDQLRWCGDENSAVAIRIFAAKSKDKAVRDFANQIAKEINAKLREKAD